MKRSLSLHVNALVLLGCCCCLVLSNGGTEALPSTDGLHSSSSSSNHAGKSPNTETGRPTDWQLSWLLHTTDPGVYELQHSKRVADAGLARHNRQLTACSVNCEKCKWAGTSGGLVCSKCKPRFRRTTSGDCVCRAGRYPTESSGSVTCSACPVGSYCPGGTSDLNTGIFNCASHMTTQGFAQSKLDCVNEAGYRYINADTEPAACEPGFYTAGLSYQAACQPCPPGFTTTTTANTKASDCVLKPGYFLASPGVTSQCSPGSWSTGGALTTRCTACPLGLTTAAAGSTSADHCNRTRPGYEAYLDGTSNRKARTCPQNYYCSGGLDVPSGSGGSTQCPNGKWTQAQGARSLRECLVPPGHALVNGAVTQCSENPGQYKAGWGDTPCIHCGTNILAKRQTDLGSISYTSANADTVTTSNVKVSASTSECYVPAGMGIVSVRSATTGQQVWEGRVCNRGDSVPCGVVRLATGELNSTQCSVYRSGGELTGLATQPCRLCKGQARNPAASGGNTVCELPSGKAAVSPVGNIYYTTVANEWIDIGSTTECPIGYHCPGGDPSAVTPVPCGTGETTLSAGSTASTNCGTCDVLFSSSAGRVELVTPSSHGPRLCRCKVGNSAQSGTSHDNGNLICAQCAIGSYKISTGDETCTMCASDSTTKMPGANSSSDCGSCATLFSSSVLDQSSSTMRCRCQPGYFAQPGTSHENGNLTCVPCAIGSYKDALGDGACITCVGATTTRTTTAASSTECKACSDVSMFGSTTALGSGTKECVCAPGYSYTSGSHASNTLACAPCAVGSFKSAAANTACTTCTGGLTTMTAGSTECKLCSDPSMFGAGYTLVAGGYCVCDAGYFYVSGSHTATTSNLVCQACALGSYKTATGNGANCTNCVSGTTKTTASITSVDCKLCADAAMFGTGSLLPTGSRQCACNLGFFSTGTHDTTSANLTCTQCAIGSYKDSVAMGECTSCITGSTTKTRGSTSAVSCRVCSGGLMFSTGATLSGDRCVCNVGFSSTGSHDTADLVCTRCPVGSFKDIVGNSSCTQCGVATTTRVAGSIAAANCATCPSLFVGSTLQSGSNYCVCDAGQVPVTGTIHNETRATLSCGACPLGSYKSDPGNNVCTACDPTTSTTTRVTASTSSTQCRTCSELFGVGVMLSGTQCQCTAGFSSSGSHTATTSSLTCTVCALRTYKNLTGSGSCTTCGSGLTTRKIGSTDASQCRPCNDISMFSFSQLSGSQCVCISGYYNEYGTHTSAMDNLTCSQCPIGTYKGSAGNVQCTKCASGTTKLPGSTGLSNCATCSNTTTMFGTGAVLDNATSLCVCNSGYFSTGGHSATASNLTCSVCAAGSFKASPGNTACSLCPIGSHQALTGSTSCTNCTAPLTTSSTGSTDSTNQCKNCVDIFTNSEPTPTGDGNPKICRCLSGFSSGGTSHESGSLVCA